MPYLRGDPAAFDEILSEMGAENLAPAFAEKRPTDEFEYQPAEATFDPKKLGVSRTWCIKRCWRWARRNFGGNLPLRGPVWRNHPQQQRNGRAIAFDRRAACERRPRLDTDPKGLAG